jgi:hypothetical protein
LTIATAASTAVTLMPNLIDQSLPCFIIDAPERLAVYREGQAWGQGVLLS